MLHNADSHPAQDKWNQIQRCSQNLMSFKSPAGFRITDGAIDPGLSYTGDGGLFNNKPT